MVKTYKGGDSIYNLFSNVITPKAEHLCKFKSNNFRGEIICYIKKQVHTILESEEVSAYYNFLSEVYEICENIRASNMTVAHEIYKILLYELTNRTYINLNEDSKRATFCDKLDFTEIYYNLGKLKWDSGDYDNALLYIVHSDIEYSKHNLKPRGTFIKFLLNSTGYVLWNIIPCLENDFLNYSRQFGISSIKDITGKELTEDLIKELLNDFNILLLLQFINSINRYHNFSYEISNEYKILREFRILGDLSWLFECYLKDKFKVEGKLLHSLIQELLFADIKEYRRQFDSYNKKDTHVKDSKSKKRYEESLKYMLKELKTKNNPEELVVICIRIIYLFRNYSAHYIDERFFSIGTEYYSKELYTCILSSFIVAYKLINKAY